MSTVINEHMQYAIYNWMLEHVYYYINFKVRSSCKRCHHGVAMDDRLICFQLAPRYHSRSNLLWFFTDAMSTTWDMLSTETVFEDLQGYTRLELMKFGHKIEDIDNMNQLENIKSIAYHDMAAEYIFNRLWSLHPSVIPTLSPQQPHQGAPLERKIDVYVALAQLQQTEPNKKLLPMMPTPELQQQKPNNQLHAELQHDLEVPKTIFQAIQLANSGNYFIGIFKISCISQFLMYRLFLILAHFWRILFAVY